MIAANMFGQELTTAIIAASLKVDDQTVRRWRRRFEAQGRDGLRSSKHAGRPPRLTQQQKEQLAELLLLKTPQECGFEGRYLWTQQLMAGLIQREFGVDYHHDHASA